MSERTPSLLELQRAMQASIAAGADAAVLPTIAYGASSAAERLSIYRSTAVTTLTNALQLTYPAVRRLVGDAFFEGAAQAFVADRWARTSWLDDYGREFAAFLTAFPPAATVSYLGDVARLEWLVNRALHAPDVAPIDLARLSKLSAADSQRLRFVAHPSLGLLRANAPVDVIWHATLADDDAALQSIDLSDAPVHLLVERTNTSVQVRRLGETEWHLTAALCAGDSLQAALAPCADGAGALLAEHLTAGRFIDFELGEVELA